MVRTQDCCRRCGSDILDDPRLIYVGDRGPMVLCGSCGLGLDDWLRRAPERPAQVPTGQEDTLPEFVRDLVAARKLTGVDILVLSPVLEFRRRDADSCWTSKAVLARAINRTPRTVRRSLARMTAAGVIQHIPVGQVDPEDAANRTGWRIVFPWLAGAAPGGRKAEANSLSGGGDGCDGGHGSGESTRNVNGARVLSPT